MVRARRLPAQHRKRQIIDSARELFASQSYRKVGTADVAKAAGVSEPALYRYFSSKKELFLATLRPTGPKLLEIWQSIASEIDDPLETLSSIGVLYYDHLQSHSGGMQLLFQALSEADEPEIRQTLRENFLGFVRFVAETLEEGKRRGIVRRGLDTELVAWQFLGMGLTLDLMHSLGFASELDRGKMEQWFDLFQQTLQAPARQQGTGPGVRAVSELVAPQGWPLEA